MQKLKKAKRELTKTLQKKPQKTTKYNQGQINKIRILVVLEFFRRAQ